MKGVIASDIDGTLTDAHHVIPHKVAAYLESLHCEGWQICLVTGRMYSFARQALIHMRFPYFLILQNGADVLVMPEERVVSRHFLSKKDLSLLPGDFFVYSGYERGDFCYYQKGMMTPYLEKLRALSREEWCAVSSWEEIRQEEVSLVKYVGAKESLKVIETTLQESGRFSLATIRDTVDPSLYILMVTTKIANKGTIIRLLMKEQGWQGPLIAAGDQNNDLPLFLEADCAIAMQDAGKELLEHADIIAPLSIDMGIIQGLEKAITSLK